MPRKIKLADWLSSDELQKRWNACQEPIEKRRWHSLWLISSGETAIHVAESLGISELSVRKTLRLYNADGPERMKNHRYLNKGAALLLDAPAMQELYDALLKPPPDGGYWSGSQVNQWLEQKTARRVSKHMG